MDVCIFVVRADGGKEVRASESAVCMLVAFALQRCLWIYGIVCK